MIQVEHLSKSYGATRAVDRVTFGVGRGEIVGFLGPNGAGKTTTMRMLTTYLTPTSGQARLAGFDVLDEPLEVRRHLGYLPEQVPLYPEMRVREYLAFRGRLKDVPGKRRRAAVSRVVELCRLGEVESVIIGHLSKGYRQRVGLAEALVHEPEILILDEPTAGLDPIQIREVRALIRKLGDHHTILLSTHIMQEVEAVCGRVIMLVGGRIAVDDSLEHLQANSAILLEARGPAEAIRKAIGAIEGVSRVSPTESDDGHAAFLVESGAKADPREELARRIVQNGWGLVRLERRKSTLEERFVQAVRDAAVGREETTRIEGDARERRANEGLQDATAPGK